MDVQEITQLEAEIAQKQARAAKLRSNASHELARDLAAFEALTDVERREVYEAAPEVYSLRMEQLRERNEKALMNRGRRSAP